MQSLLQTAVHRLSHSELLTQHTFSSGNQCNFKLVGSPHHEASVLRRSRMNLNFFFSNSLHLLAHKSTVIYQQSYSTNLFITLSDSISHGVPRDPNRTTMPLHPLRGQAASLPI
ncbi:hypothetical protein E4U48_008279 [Claviceps purpurea]|nr:hypothetical protein E4U48_008279 [Claviceps purpurea]